MLRISIYILIFFLGCQSVQKPIGQLVEETKQARTEFEKNPTPENKKRFVKSVETLEKASIKSEEKTIEQAETIEEQNEKIKELWKAARNWYILVGSLCLIAIGFIAFKVLRATGRI